MTKRVMRKEDKEMGMMTMMKIGKLWKKESMNICVFWDSSKY